MTVDPMWIWIALGVVALLIVVLLFARGARRARTAELRDKFGPEYGHAVETAGNRKRAERELLARANEVQKYAIRSLTAAERDRYRTDWQRIEQRFVERPVAAVAEADELVADIMRVQGYPMGDFDKHAADLSVTHPRIVEHYRSGHRVIGGEDKKPSTEDLRQAMLHYRALFEELSGAAMTAPAANDVVRDIPRENEAVDTLRRERENVHFTRDEERR